MSRKFIECNRDQMYLMPPSLREWLPEGDLAWFLLDAVSELDLCAFHLGEREDGAGRPSYDPDMMASLLLYAYCLGERSSRKIERQCLVNVGFRVIAANQIPDYSTICRFRQSHAEALEGLFVQVLRLCAESGLVRVGRVALDGTKIKANAALSANRTEESIREEVRRMLAEAEAVDAEEDEKYGKDRRGDELPEELQAREGRLKRLHECKERLEREAEEKKATQEKKIEDRQAEEAATGKRKRGRKPKNPDELERKKAKANVTDPESRIMKTRHGYVQGYNAQAAVTEDQVIIAAEVTQEENDVRQLHPMLEKAAETLEAAGVNEKMGAALADAGYFSDKNLTDASLDGPELFVATTKDWKQRKAMADAPPPRGRIPKHLSSKERMERKLLTVRGRATYKKRGQTVEPVFGQIKDARGCDRFLQRGLSSVSAEWKLICAAHNLLKLFGSGKARWCAPAAQAA
jgi:transposase